MATKRRRRNSFGSLRKRDSGRWQATYTGPDGARHNAPQTFYNRLDAEAWLMREHQLMESGTWTSPATRAKLPEAPPVLTVKAYAEQWMKERQQCPPAEQLRPKTRAEYERLLARHVYPTLGEVDIKALDRAAVRAWVASLNPETPRQTNAAFSLLRTICRAAVAAELIEVNPCEGVKAGSARRAKRIRVYSPAEVSAIAAEMPERLALMIYLGGYCAMRYGEVAELRRKDFDLDRGVVSVSRGVVWVDGQPVAGSPKTEAGIREVTIPSQLLPMVREHLATHTQWGRDGLLFPSGTGGQIRAETFHRNYFRRARERAGLEGATFHGLRHTAAVLALQGEGITFADVQAFLGHASAAAALRYQHAAAESGKRIAAALDLRIGGVSG